MFSSEVSIASTTDLCVPGATIAKLCRDRKKWRANSSLLFATTFLNPSIISGFRSGADLSSFP
jgi:hypothetical protein